MQKLSNDGFQEPTSGETFLALLTSYALAIQASWLACNQLQRAISQLESPKLPRVRWSVVSGRPVSGLSSRGGAKLKVVGK
jgi:hypothetical protein